jgi:Pyridoxamine 5'-phosphate oxidase
MSKTGPVAWALFADAAPGLASFGRSRLEQRVAYLATLRADGAPRVHPVSPFIGAGGLYLYMEPTSPKAADLGRDARYGMHCGVENDSGGGGELYVTGEAREIVDAPTRELAFAAARSAGYRPAERHVLFELLLERVLATTYDDGPRRERWPAVSCR